MNTEYAVIMGVTAALGMIWPMTRLSSTTKRRINGYGFFVDIAAAALVAYLFFGTMTGMVIAAIASVLFSGYMGISRSQNGVEHLTHRGWRRTR